MKKIFFFAAIAALALSSCSSDEIVKGDDLVLEEGAVVFDAQTLRDTRGTLQDVDLGYIQTNGFGVFAYEQGKANYSTFAASTSYPNFMYNQKVNKDGTKWTYTPVKYYSNNEGAKHSFFAYAPYRQEATPVFALGKAPQIRYNVTENYDLLWAVPTLDKEKGGVSETINFDFRHALSKVTFHVAPFVDKVHGTHGFDNLTSGTTVTVKSIRFVGNVPSQALLDLETGKWTIENTQEGEYLVNTSGAQWAGPSAPTEYKSLTAFKTIPSDGVKIEIVYDVVTKDGATTSGANDSKVTNKVVSLEDFDLRGGMAYDFYLDLGLTSVQFTANTIDWADANDERVDLPNNHDLKSVSRVVVYAAPAVKAVATSAPTAAPTAGDLWYDNGILKSYKDGYTSTYAGNWDVVEDGVYNDQTNNKIYVVSNGACDIVYFYYLEGKFYAPSGTALVTTPIISTRPNSEGKLQKTDGEWVAMPTDEGNHYYSVGSFLYNYYVASTSSNRR